MSRQDKAHADQIAKLEREGARIQAQIDKAQSTIDAAESTGCAIILALPVIAALAAISTLA